MSTERPLSIAIAALGGQGGGVLADWIIEIAERHGWLVQLTSVPGVAQRTGTTVYYLETCPRPAQGAEPDPRVDARRRAMWMWWLPPN